MVRARRKPRVWNHGGRRVRGAEFDAEIEGQTARDTTLGPPKPIGRRGATVADVKGGKRA